MAKTKAVIEVFVIRDRDNRLNNGQPVHTANGPGYIKSFSNGIVNTTVGLFAEEDVIPAKYAGIIYLN